MVSIKFIHGLGDVSNFCHQIPLYVKRGHEIQVECTADKAPLFLASGATVVSRASRAHPWSHAPQDRPNLHNHYSSNKSGHNLSQGPLPYIGSPADLWHEHCEVKLSLDQFVTPEIKHTIDSYINTLPRPLILFHPQGNTGCNSKNIEHKLQEEILQGLIQRTEASIINLDWDKRVYRLHNYRIRHLTDDWQSLNLIELYYLIKQADLVIGIDSGVLHFTRFTDTPTIGLWVKNYPAHFALPRDHSCNVVGSWNSNLTRFRRLPFNIIEAPGNSLDSNTILAQAERMLAPGRYLEARGPDTLLQSLLMKTGQDRNRSFDLLLQRLRMKERPLIVETGCIRAEEDWSAGYSSYLFGLFLKHHGGNLISVDLDPNNCNFARTWTTNLPVNVVHSHSHNFFKNYKADKISALYLDSHDADLPGHEENCLEEAKLALPFLAEAGLILIDDTPFHNGRFHGKGSQAVPWLLSQGMKILYAGYQVLLERT